MNRGGGSLGLDDLVFVSAEHSDSPLELSDAVFKSFDLFMQLLRIAEDKTL